MFLFSSITFSGEEIIQAVSWTLLHSLWQGILVSLIAGCILFLTKKTSPTLRYNLLTATFVFFIIAVAATFIIQLANAKQSVNTSSIIEVQQINTEETPADILPVKSESTVTAWVITFFTVNAHWIVLTWLLIIGYKFIRLSFGLYNMHQLKRRQVSSAGEYWNSRITELCRQLQINKKVQLLQSGIARIPSVIGYFKPVILFPAAILTSMPLNEVEAILIHELGHIRRKDFLVNMLQNIIEIIFFFNPTILWISSLLKTERENCCDDIAVTHTGNKKDYIKALITFQQFSQPVAPQLTTAFSGEKKYLLNRIKRIIYSNNKTLNNMEKKFLSAGMIMAGICFFTFAQSKPQEKARETNIVSTVSPAAARDKITPVISIAADTIPGKEIHNANVLNGKINTVVDGKQYTIVTKNNQANELYVDGKKIPSEKIGEYKTVTDKIMKQVKIDMEQSKKDLEQSARDLEQSAKDLEQSAKDLEQSKKDLEQSKIDMAQSKIDMEQSRKDMEQSKKDMEQSKKDMEQSRKDMELSRKDMEQSKIVQEKIIRDFISGNIIKDIKELHSYKLNTEELIVNGIKQPETIHKKFKDKYVKNNSWSMIYESDGVYQK